ncbi:hypothetical protein R3F72_16345 [Salinicola sp. 4072]|uniref:hypothetical protein n=1 Tax=Salinicola TaxID=404432 RepID=UPI00117ACD10|nr:hypothetical protein [Salinicola salarius]
MKRAHDHHAWHSSIVRRRPGTSVVSQTLVVGLSVRADAFIAVSSAIGGRPSCAKGESSAFMKTMFPG